MLDLDFWAGQRVLLTGHTGFKGSWASLWLERLGATVAGYALAPDHKPDLFSRLAPFAGATSTIGDLAEAGRLKRLAEDFQPTLLLHMAAQPLVRRSYAQPAATFATNVQGTVNVLEAVRGLSGLRAALVVTTDKVYANSDQGRPFIEGDRLGGHDPYSASKAAAELITASYAASFFEPAGVPVATARAGNVIGGGDWSEDRLIPDIWRALQSGTPLSLRYPHATRPWQHVLEPIAGYLTYVERLAAHKVTVPRALNFGPAEQSDALTVAAIADGIQQEWGVTRAWVQAPGDHPAEMKTLTLDASAAIDALDWRPRLSAHEALEWTAEWYRRYDRGENPRKLTIGQLEAYEAIK